MSVSETALKDYDLLRDDSGRISLPEVALVMMRGDDRKGWLQGQATNDLRKLEPGNSSEFCLVAITGHIQTVCQCWALPDFIALTLPEATLSAFLQRVDQMVILEDVVAEVVSGKYSLFSIQGPSATAKLSAHVTLPSLDAGIAELNGAQVFCLRSNRTGLGGWDIWIPSEATDAIGLLSAEFAEVCSESREAARLEAGIPKFGQDFGDRTFPPELGASFLSRTVSYSKGCYVGQEVLMRIHSRGHTNRTWVGLISDTPITIGAKVSHLGKPDIGTVTSVAFSPDYGNIGAAIIRNEAAYEGETVKLISEGSTTEAEVKLMPILKLT